MSDKPPKLVDHPEQQEMFNKLLTIVYAYDGKLSVAAAVGVLMMVIDEVKSDE